jgi:hypothetical protein
MNITLHVPTTRDQLRLRSSTGIYTVHTTVTSLEVQQNVQVSKYCSHNDRVKRREKTGREIETFAFRSSARARGCRLCLISPPRALW